MIIIVGPLSKALLNSGLPFRPTFASKTNKTDMEIELFNIGLIVQLKLPVQELISRLVSITALSNSKTHPCYINKRAELFK